jgi:uncharacterized protein
LTGGIVPNDLETLLDLQDRDRVVVSLKSELKALDPEEQALDEALREVEEELATATGELEKATQARKELEAKIEGYRVMQERKRAKLEFVKGAKEASALMAELDLARTVMAREETDWLQSADVVENAEVRAANARAGFEEITETQSAQRDEIGAKKKTIDKKIRKAEKMRDEARTPIGRELLTRYERVRQGNAPFSLYELHGEACGHCFTHVPKHIQQRLRNGNEIVTCQVCGVMLFVTPQ